MSNFEQFKKRFTELENEATPYFLGSIGLAIFTKNEINIPNEILLNWQIKAHNLIEKSCGKDSVHLKKFNEVEETLKNKSTFTILKNLLPILLAAKSDFEDGLIKSIQKVAHAEIFNDELSQAKELYKNGYFAAAAVIAGTVLETKLRKLCSENKIEISKLDRMNIELCKLQIHNTNNQKLITALAGIRNSAAHGKKSEFTPQDVKSMIESIERYVQEH